MWDAVHCDAHVSYFPRDKLHEWHWVNEWVKHTWTPSLYQKKNLEILSIYLSILRKPLNISGKYISELYIFKNESSDIAADDIKIHWLNNRGVGAAVE